MRGGYASAKLTRQIRRVAVFGREGELGLPRGEGDAANEELCTVCEQGAGLGEALQRVFRPWQPEKQSCSEQMHPLLVSYRKARPCERSQS